MQASNLIFFSCSWFFSHYCLSIWYPFPIFFLTCRLLTKSGTEQTKVKAPPLPQYHSPSPCPIHCGMVSWALLTSERYQPIPLLDLPCCQGPEITVHPPFYLFSSSCLLTFLPHEKLLQLATIPATPLLCLYLYYAFQF